MINRTLPEQDPQVFYKLNFSFAEIPGVAFDPEVAFTIAESVARRDGGRYNHSHSSSFSEVNVSVADFSAPTEAAEDDYFSIDVVLPRDTLSGSYDPNAVFAREFQRALDTSEHKNRASIPVAIGMFAILSAIPGGATAAVMAENGLTTEEALLAAGIGATFNTVGLGGYHAFRSIYRRIITSDKYTYVHKSHLDKAARLAEKLDLPPVLSRSQLTQL